MHSSEGPAVEGGPALLLQLGRMVAGPRLHKPSNRQLQQKPESSLKPALDAQLCERVHALCRDDQPVCIEVYLAPDCVACGAGSDKHATRALLLERWTCTVSADKPENLALFSSSQWLLNAVRSQLHFSQLCAWLATLTEPQGRRRKLSRETCSFRKTEDDPATDEPRSLNIVYSIRAADQLKQTDFSRTPKHHTFPITDIGNKYLKVTLETLPRLDEVPTVKCTCQKTRPRDSTNEDIVGKLNDLSIGNKTLLSDLGAFNSNIGTHSRRLSVSNNDAVNIVDDRMHTTCSENGKHKCNCDEESDGNQKVRQETKKLDDRRIKEIAKYKRRLRKESKLKRLCDSTSSEGDKAKETTSIPILQAARFERLRAIGWYRNQTYLTLPATRIECKTPFIETFNIPPAGFKKTSTIATQTEESCRDCGVVVQMNCNCNRMVRSDGNYHLSSVDSEVVKRSHEDDETISKKLKCDKPSINDTCDNINFIKKDTPGNEDVLIKRPKLRRIFPIVDKLEKIVNDRFGATQKDIDELHLKTDDTVFLTPKLEPKRQKTFSISEDDYVLYEKSEYGTLDRCDLESPSEITNGFPFPESPLSGQESSPDISPTTPQRTPRFNSISSKEGDYEYVQTEYTPQERLNDETEKSRSILNEDTSPESSLSSLSPEKSPEQVDVSPEGETETKDFRANNSIRNKQEKAESMVFHSRTGLPLASSPAPMKRGTNGFDFDRSINGVSDIKSALFAPLPAPLPAPLSPAVKRRDRKNKLVYRPNRCLLGSFEESILKNRLPIAATVTGFTAELSASGSFTSPHTKLPVTVCFYALSPQSKPYMGHIDLGPSGYKVAPCGTIQLSLFNPHGTLVRVWCVPYELSWMGPRSRTFLRQRTMYVPNRGQGLPGLRYSLHLRFMTSKSGKLYLHSDIRLIVSRRADLDTATGHSLLKQEPTNHSTEKSTNRNEGKSTNNNEEKSGRSPNRIFGGSSSEDANYRDFGYENQNGGALQSFTYAPDDPKYSPR